MMTSTERIRYGTLAGVSCMETNYMPEDGKSDTWSCTTCHRSHMSYMDSIKCAVSCMSTKKEAAE